jgi:glycosyltransferase involved in cell wall biosynthesis
MVDSFNNCTVGMEAQKRLAPKVTIGMPVYNGGRFLEEALNSILSQTFTAIEVIISDNASTDTTEVICRSYAARDTRIRYYRNHTNLGAASNYNRTFQLSSGEFFKWAAADDVCAPNFLEKCVEVLDARPEIVLCYPKTRIIDEHGKFITEYEDRLNLRSIKVNDRFRQALRDRRECNAVFGLIRSKILHKTPLIGNYISADRILLVWLTLYGQFYEIPECLFFRRQHSSSYSGRVRDRELSRIQRRELAQEWYNPQTKDKISMFAWNLIFQCLTAIKHAPLRNSVKLHLIFIVLRELISFRHRLIKEPLQALGQRVRRMPFF